MKRRWLLALLAVSVAGNIVELGLLAFREWKRRRDQQVFFDDLAAGAYSSSIFVLDRWREAEFESLGREVLRLERERVLADEPGRPDSVALAAVARELARLRRRRLALAFQSRQRAFELPDSGLRHRLAQRWRRMTGLQPLPTRRPARPGNR